MDHSSESNPLFKAAVKAYRDASGGEFARPDKHNSTHERGAWMLRDPDGRLLAIARDSGEVVHGAMLAALFRQFQIGMLVTR